MIFIKMQDQKELKERQEQCNKHYGEFIPCGMKKTKTHFRYRSGDDMKKNWLILICVTGMGALAGCAQFPSGGEGPLVETAACTGSINVPYGLVEVADDTLLKQVVQPAGKGGLCDAKVFKVAQPLTVYRVWDQANQNSQYGRWWSFNPPAGPVGTYRAANAICPEWSALNRVKQCRLKVGAEIVIGPGQSALCSNNLTYPQSATNQVFVPNDTRDPKNLKLDVGDCLADAAWP
ncbi:hypothetical protein FAZ69_19245 [Trinickia terrae]|uniref:Uncharacterized protein n=1 Tax=Trinickia terrae TaxID=2571161 RepID=A0A4U1I0X6_9BURK|nr:hypothetical protein [Trinickia terrae]TKC86789.1 hypothetical protein FAZ69_19245 [Trinickia terrae]